MNLIGVQMRITTKNKEIESKRQDVREAFKRGEFNLYEKLFDELHDLIMVFMAESYRKERGLPPHTKTPYC